MKPFAFVSALFLLVFSVIPGFAQEDLPALTEEFTSEDGRLTLYHPADWVALEDDIVIVTHQDALPAVEAEEPIPDGYLALAVFTPSIFADVGLDEDATPDEAIEAVLTSEDVELADEVTAYATSDLSGLSAVIIEPNDMVAQLIALEFETGTVLMIFRYGADFDSNIEYYMDLTDHLVNAVIFDGQPASDEVAVEDLDDDGLLSQWAMEVSGSSQYGEEGWSFAQAAGEPDTEECGDYVTAWASAQSNSVEELVLEFRYPVIPTEVNIYQTYNPGSIVAVDLVSETGDIIELEDSADPLGNTPCPGVFSFEIEGVDEAVMGVIIHLDQSEIANWNEIDAVELVGEPTTDLHERETRQWASEATGSSQYGEEGYSFMQATGSPDVDTCGDNDKAWTAAGGDTEEMLELVFDEAVIPWEINIYQTYNPGSIVAVELVTETGEIIELEDSADPLGNTPCPGIFTLDIEDVEVPVNGVIIYLDQTEIANWNEIDAVELVGEYPADE